MNRFQRILTATVGVAVLAAPAAGAFATVPKKVVVITRKVTGTPVQAGQWGPLQVALTVRKTTTTVGTKTTIARKVIRINIPEYPSHTDRSVYINQQALPLLMQETLKSQNANIQMVSGASYSSQAYIQSLQAALRLEKKV
jgi:uncharacterized protein with FMN-binding domain